MLLGGGRRSFLPEDIPDSEYPDESGRRTDGRNIIDEWLDLHAEDNAQYVWNEEGFKDIDTDETDYLLGKE